MRSEMERMDTAEASFSSFRALSLAEFHKKHLDGGGHSDGRPLLDFRSCSLQAGVVSSANGSVWIKQGSTTVMCSVKAEICQPDPEKPNRGFVVANLDCSPGTIGEQERNQLPQYQRLLNDLIESGVFLPLTSLCIREGSFAWVLYCDLLCMDSDGALLDTCFLALAAALKDTKLPQIVVSDIEPPADTQVSVTKVKEKSEMQIQVDFDTWNSLEFDGGGIMPVASTFSCYVTEDEDSGQLKPVIVADPSEEELFLFAGSLTVAVVGLKAEEPICGIWYFASVYSPCSGESVLDSDSFSVSNFLLSGPAFDQLLAICRRRCGQINRLITEGTQRRDRSAD